MKKLFVILSSLFVITAMSDVYADNPNTRLNVGESCTANGVTVNRNSKELTVTVPNNNSINVNVRMNQTVNGQDHTDNYDTRSNNVLGKSSQDGKYTTYKYDYNAGYSNENGRETQVDVKCYPK